MTDMKDEGFILKPRLDYLGRHTTIGYLGPEQWREIPYLRDNGGCLPPYILALGDARRVRRAITELDLEEPLLLHEAGEAALGPVGRGRVDIVIGVYRHEGRAIPLVIVETQMGMSPTQIIMREVLAHTVTTYRVQGETVGSGKINLIRAGSAGGINFVSPPEGVTPIEVGDVVNATFSAGYSGAVIQSIAGIDLYAPQTWKQYQEVWKAWGLSFTRDGGYPMAESDPAIIAAIRAAADELGVRCHEGGNFSKDSLYAETRDDVFLALRQKYDIMSTEMEHLGLAALAGECRTKSLTVGTGLVSGVIGTMPGASFDVSPEAKGRAEQVEGDVLRVAALALWRLDRDGKRTEEAAEGEGEKS